MDPRKKGPRGVDPNKVRDRARGALLGLAVGDALGTTNETKQLSAPAYPTLADGLQREMMGGGPFHLIRGQVTDDTQMATCLAASLRELKKYDAEDVLQRYLAWEKHGFDIDPQVKAVFEHVRRGMLPRVASREVWIQSAKRSAGNASLVRTIPIGLYFSKDRQARIRAALDDSALTHFDPRCQLMCVVFDGALAAALQALGDPKPEQMVQAALTDLTVAAAMLGKEAIDDVHEVRDALEVIRADLELARHDDPELYGPDVFFHRHAGFIRLAFRLAFWHLFHTPSLETALTDVVSRGGDSETNAAITGALLGVVQGESAIPADWKTPVQEALFNKLGPLWETYHPNQLLLLLE